MLNSYEFILIHTYEFKWFFRYEFICFMNLFINMGYLGSSYLFHTNFAVFRYGVEEIQNITRTYADNEITKRHWFLILMNSRSSRFPEWIFLFFASECQCIYIKVTLNRRHHYNSIGDSVAFIGYYVTYNSCLLL